MLPLGLIKKKDKVKTQFVLLSRETSGLYFSALGKKGC